ncbi:MAG: CpsD/CapB family tyrosine-protein kinase [Ilumatobacter sp.]|nr:CpsD/CapB family tyrosine-protein kinase [Ilumatobacter sp.]
MARKRNRPGPSPSAARPEQGGLLLTGVDGETLHVVPPEVAEALRFFVTRTQTSRWLGDHRTVAVTSALAGEGVSFTARSLAAITAHDLQRSVCLVETNWWAQSRRRRHDETPVRRGLAEIMEGGAALDDVLVSTSDPRLAILPAGETPIALRPVLVASDEFAAVLDKIASRFDTVVLDVPPVLRASEAITICDRCEATILVVEHGVTPERQVAQALEELEGVDVLGLLFNRTRSKIPRILRSLTAPI